MQLTRHEASAVPDVVLNRPMPQPLAWGIAIGALAVIFAPDRATALAPVQHLYYLPIIFAGIRFSYRGGALGAAAAILLYHAANPRVMTFPHEESDLVWSPRRRRGGPCAWTSDWRRHAQRNGRVPLWRRRVRGGASGCGETRARAIADDVRGAVSGCAPVLAGAAVSRGNTVNQRRHRLPIVRRTPPSRGTRRSTTWQVKTCSGPRMLPSTRPRPVGVIASPYRGTDTAWTSRLHGDRQAL
jgi:hypothetical protein